MRISIRAYGLLQDAFASKDWAEIDIGEGATVEELIGTVKLPQSQVMTVLNRGSYCAMDYRIREGDRLEILPLVSGG